MTCYLYHKERSRGRVFTVISSIRHTNTISLLDDITPSHANVLCHINNVHVRTCFSPPLLIKTVLREARSGEEISIEKGFRSARQKFGRESLFCGRRVASIFSPYRGANS